MRTEGETSITCGRNVDPSGYVPCGKPAVTFCLHEGDVCAYCSGHHYICGEVLTREQAARMLESHD